MDKEIKNNLIEMAKNIRIDIIDMLCESGSGHSAVYFQ